MPDLAAAREATEVPTILVAVKTSDGAKTAVVDASQWLKDNSDRGWLINQYDMGFATLVEDFDWTEHGAQEDVKSLLEHLWDHEDDGSDIDVHLSTDTGKVMPFIAYHMPKTHAWMLSWITILAEQKSQGAPHAQ